jgi:hypothetical protein
MGPLQELGTVFLAITSTAVGMLLVIETTARRLRPAVIKGSAREQARTKGRQSS